MLKATADAIAPSVTKLFNSSIRCCHTPSSWKISSVVPIPKVPLANSTADYRPISLFSILSKVLERHFHSLILEHLSTSSSLADCQWGFQPGKSMVLALLDTTHKWLQHLEKGEEIAAVFFNYKKAFDSVPHSPLLPKLHAIGSEPGIVSCGFTTTLQKDVSLWSLMVLHLKPQQLPLEYHKDQYLDHKDQYLDHTVSA